MLIHSLTLENVKSYAQETVKFKPRYECNRW